MENKIKIHKFSDKPEIILDAPYGIDFEMNGEIFNVRFDQGTLMISKSYESIQIYPCVSNVIKIS